MFPVLAVNALVVWSLLAVGSVYAWGAIPVALASAAIALWTRPRFGGSTAPRWLDGALLALLAATALQLLPLPRPLLSRLSPSVGSFDAVYRLGVPADGPRALALDPPVTAYTLIIVAGIVALFWSCRRLFVTGGVRRCVRTISWLGFAVSIGAVVQRATAPGYVYGFWQPLDPGASPIGPVVNANQLAAWLLLALPLSIGYLVAHLETHRSDRLSRNWQSRVRQVIDVRSLFLAASSLLMALVILFSGSRSAMTGLLIAGLFGWLVGSGRTGPDSRRTIAALALVLGVAAIAWLNLDALADRFNRLDAGIASRTMIWRDTLSVAGQYWLTGVGLGGYQAAMTVYQAATREVFYNHAHSQYLQLLAEGGLLLTLPAVVAIAALVIGARARLAADRSAIWSIRVGAASGLVAVAVQSVWETVLRMPANGVLMAVAAAILLHPPPGDDSQG